MKSTVLQLMIAFTLATPVAQANQGSRRGPPTRHPDTPPSVTVRPAHPPRHVPRPVPPRRRPAPRPPVIVAPPPHYPPPHYPPPHYPPPSYPPPSYPPPRYEQDYFTRNLYMTYSGYQTVDLRSLLGLTTVYNGRDVEYVLIRARSNYGYGQMQLRTNMFPNSSIAHVGTYPQNHYLYVTGNRELGWGVNTLELELQGQITVESITVKLGHRNR